MKIVRNLTALAAVAASLTFAAQARAAPLDFWLTQGECTGSCGAGTAPAPISDASAVEVQINLLSSTSATVEFIAPSGDIDTPAYINVNDGGVVGNVSATVSIAGGVTRSDPGQAEDHFGDMNTWTGAVKAPTVTFTLTALNGFDWTSAASVLMATTGYGAAYGQGFDAVTAAQYAGFISATPLPATLPLFASGFGALGLLGWRRKRKAQALAA